MMATTATVPFATLGFELPNNEDQDYQPTSARKRIRYTQPAPTRSNRLLASTQPNGYTMAPAARAPARRSLARSSRSQRNRGQARPTYDSAAAAAAAATTQVDGYKPREERSWEEFHPDLDIDLKVTVFSANEVDGVAPEDADEGEASAVDQARNADMANGVASSNRDLASPSTPSRRRPGRPFRRADSMLHGLGSPPGPRIVPLPAQNPRERLNLPKPSYRRIETFATFEADKANSVNYVDKTMANVGYQESEMYLGNERHFVRLMERALKEDHEPSLTLEADGDPENGASAPPVSRVEYDMDEQDREWLDDHNNHRKEGGVENIKPAMFEITMTQIEKEWHALEKRIPKPNPRPPQTHRPRSSSAAAVNGEPPAEGEEQDSKCAICDDGDCENANAIVFCDGCDLAVHQECYGVPYIPEGQWLCRKCREIGRSTPACIFCPNPDGAFKKSTEGKWAHLLCAIWIPEVTIATKSIMEPIDGVANVPKSRWRLTCYLCHQRMGACIQCGMKHCYQAFHVTCGRKAKLYLKMKSSHGGPFSIDASVLTAYCDKHVSDEWESEHGTEKATMEAKDFYRRTMRGRKYADSQQAALSMAPAQHTQSVEPLTLASSQLEGASRGTIAAQEKKMLQAQKSIWRMPSGAPVVPQVVFNAVELSLQRFALRRRKEFVAEACKYWTLKRDARRGAALLKRLQLQLETFSSTELTRRDFTAMGAAGRPRLQRRKDMADLLLADMERIRSICEAVRDREACKLESVKVLQDVVDTVYIPLPKILRPIIFKVQSLDSRRIFGTEPFRIRENVDLALYASVSEFAGDLGNVLRTIVGGLDTIVETFDATERSVIIAQDANLTSEQKDVKKVGKRIVKAVQQPLLAALRAEAELNETSIKDDHTVLRDLLVGDSSGPELPAISTSNGMTDGNGENAPEALVNGDTTVQDELDVTQKNERAFEENKAMKKLMSNTSSDVADRLITKQDHVDEPADGIDNRNGQGDKPVKVDGTSTAHVPDLGSRVIPIIKTHNADKPPSIAQGGIPWYLETFDPVGTTIQQERWTGREVVRSMSEDLSELDDQELNDLSMNVEGDEPDINGGEDSNEEAEDLGSVKKRVAKRRRKRFPR
ncbi:MAG: nuA3 HAT complex component nto1 [Chrysothrix sp. TS-e1954]|nr:MAG: nuA3 HAT complex component nto1 [Chrysothrix sp. TS-e1954]